MGTNRVHFTKAKIEALQARNDGGRAYFYDTKTRGLALSVTASGTKTFLVYRWLAGRPERMFLGRFPDLTIEQARDKAEEINGAIAKAKASGDPWHKLKYQKRGELTLGELLEDFLQNQRSRRGAYLCDKTKLNYRSDFNRYFAKLAILKLSDIRQADIATIHTRVGKTAPYAANRALALMSSLYTFAKKRGLHRKENPASRIQKFPEEHRQRFIGPDEMPRFFKALAEETSDFRDAFLLALLTGARRDNVLSMRWCEVNLERAEWTIPQTKSGSALTVPLTPDAVEILNHRRAAGNGEFVFPSHGARGHLVEPKGAWKRLLQRARIKDLRFHDLRHTIGGALAATGANTALTMQALGHKTASASLIYQKMHRDPIREAMQRATASIFEQAGLKPKGDVVAIEKARTAR